MNSETKRGVGDNRGPAFEFNPESFREHLKQVSSDLIERGKALEDSAGRAPEKIDSDETAIKFTDTISQISECLKAINRRCDDEKAPYLKGQRMVNGFFQQISGPLETAKTKLNSILTVYQRKKAEEERQRREEDARRLREEQEAREREAREAREAFERKQKEAEAARKAAEEEARKKVDEAVKAAETEADIEAAIEVEETATEAVKAATVAASNAATKMHRTAVKARLAAQATEGDVHKAEKAAQAKPSELHRSRGDFGSTSSLRRHWTFRDVNKENIDLQALRFHFSDEAIESALRSFISAGNRSIKGAIIFETTDSVTR